METIRIRLTKEQKDQLQQISDKNFRSITGTIRNWIDCASKTDERAGQLFGGGNTAAGAAHTVAPNKEYLHE